MTAMSEPRYPLLTTNRLRMGTDGAGITTLIAGAGCPLHCKWCINAELLEREPRWVTPQELYDQVRRDDLYFRATGGGVTFGGGEALLHAEFIRAFREICGSEWRIYAETSLHVPLEQVRIAAECVDEFIVDIKDTDAKIYRDYAGGDVDLPLKNLEHLLQAVGSERVFVRVPLIPEFNTTAAQARTAAKLQAMGVQRIEPFSYILR